MSNNKDEDRENTAQEAVPEEAPTGEVEESLQAPEPTAIGNNQISILKHDIYRKDSDTTEIVSIELKIKNISDTTIGSARFRAELYDIEGNTLDTIEKKTLDFKPDITRNLRINYSGPESDKIRSYCVKLVGIAIPPEPQVTGNESIKILKHSFNTEIDDEDGESSGMPSGANIAIRNTSETTIATIIFEAVFYDIEGNIIDTTKHMEVDLKPSNSRTVSIQTAKQGIDKLKSYNIKITRMTTAEVERIQIRRNEIKTTDNGEEEVIGLVKNISDTATDAALVAAFFDSQKENIGTRVYILRNIEPNSVKQFQFKFKPMEGDRVRSYTLNVGDLVE